MTQVQHTATVPTPASAAVTAFFPRQTPPPAGGSQQEDLDLIAAMQNGETSAFDALVTKYQNRIYHHCLRLTRDADQSFDLTQEVFLRVYRNLDRYRPDHAFYTWVYRITANCCIDFLRRRKRQPADLGISPGTQALDADVNWTPEIPDDSNRPDDAMLQQETGDLIRRAIERLPEKLRTVLTLRDVDGFSYEEIANLLNCTGGTVKSRLFRARTQMRAWLSPHLA